MNRASVQRPTHGATQWRLGQQQGMTATLSQLWPTAWIAHSINIINHLRNINAEQPGVTLKVAAQECHRRYLPSEAFHAFSVQRLAVHPPSFVSALSGAKFDPISYLGLVTSTWFQTYPHRPGTGGDNCGKAWVWTKSTNTASGFSCLNFSSSRLSASSEKNIAS